LQAWQPSDSPVSPGAPTAHHDGVGDEITFGPGAANSIISWGQFAANEQMFGVTTSFDEEFYTTKLDRSAADFIKRKRKAQRIASQNMGVRPPTRGRSAVHSKACSKNWQSATKNPHIAEERNLNFDDSGVNEEVKYTFLFSSYLHVLTAQHRYAAIVRGSNAYIPPSARKQQQLQHRHRPSSAEAPAINSPPPKSDIPRFSFVALTEQ
jgi:PAB1-binding protein PBP1